MKTSISFLSCLILSISNLSAQEETYTFHYPLQIGDYWEYRYSPGFLQTVEVIGDTLMPNGKLYQIVRQEVFGFITFSFQRVSEENELFQIDQFETEEYLRFRFELREGDSWRFPNPAGGGDSLTFLVTEIGDTTLWSKSFKFVRFFSPEAFNLRFILVDSIGIYYQEFEAGFRELRGALISGQQYGILTSVRSIQDDSIESVLSSFNNYPNPFNHATTIEYGLNSSAWIRISVFNILGESVKVLNDSYQTAGSYRVNWSGKNETGVSVSSGIYFYIIEVNDRMTVKKSLLFLK